jgi:hypothetical protein
MGYITNCITKKLLSVTKSKLLKGMCTFTHSKNFVTRNVRNYKMVHLGTKLILPKERNSGFNDNSHTNIHPFLPVRSHCEPTAST